MALNIKRKLIDLPSPKVMGILNFTPDSFFDGGKLSTELEVLAQAEKMLSDGASILDIGGMSSRPGAEIITEEEELKRVLPYLKSLVSQFPAAIISIDTIRAKVADECLQAGAHIVNDISAGRFDDAMISVVTKHKAPVILMHMQGLPADMQKQPQYNNVVTEVMDFFAERVTECRQAGVTDIILDPGFGFGKTVEHNYALLRNLKYFSQLNLPVLAGVSRKSMITKPLGIKPADALNGTTAANMIALMNGAKLLRAHDVKEAVECVKIFEQLNKA